MFFKDVLSHWTVSFSNSSVRLHEEIVHFVSLVCGIIVYGHNTIFSTMNMLIIKINWSVTYVQKTSQIPSVQLSELSQGEHYKPVREIETWPTPRNHPWVPSLSSPKVTTILISISEIRNVFELDIHETL